ncbi:LPD38 domain-containing protein [Aeromonas veronii]
MDKPGLRDALPQPKLSDTRTDPFWSNLDSSLSAAAAPSAAQTPQRDLNVGLGDVARGVGAGALELVGGIGELARQASQFGKENAGKQGGDYLEQARANMASKLSPVLDVVAGAGDLAKSGAESLTDGMSGDAKEAIGRSLIDETPEGRLTMGDGAGDLDVWAMKMAQGVGSMVPTLLAGGVTGAAAKASIGRAVTTSMLKRGATQEVAEAVAAKTVAKLATSAAVTTGATGSVGSAGVNTRESVLGMSFDELSRSDTFRQAFTRIDQDQQTQHLSDEEKLSLAREETANVASRATMSDAKVWGAAAMGSVMGDAMLFKMLAGKAATGGVLKGAAKGAVGEGIGETLEEGVQQYTINESLNEVAAADIDPMKGVVSSALEGGLIGMGTGGALGGAGGLRGSKSQPESEGGAQVDPATVEDVAPVEPGDPMQESPAAAPADPGLTPAADAMADPVVAPSGEQSPLGPSASQFDELRDVPAYLRRDDTAERFKGMAADSEVQRALAGEFGQSVQELVASQMQAGDQGKSLYERAQAGELGLDPFAGNKSAQQVAMENQRPALPLKDVIFAGDANAARGMTKEGHFDDKQAGAGPQFRGAERTRWQSGQEGDVLPPESSSTKPAGELPGAVIEGEAREVGTELPHRDVVYGADQRQPDAKPMRGSATDSVFGPLQTLRITRKGKPFATEKEAAMASRKGQEMPVPLNGGGFGVAAIGEVQQAQAQQGAVKQPSSNSAQQDRQDGKTEIAQNGMVIVHGSGNPGMSEQDIQIVRASGQKQGKKGRVYGGFYGTSEQDAHQAQAYADMMGGTPTLYDVKIKPGTKVLHKQGDITRLSESYINELVSQGYGVVTGTDPRGQTEHVVIDKSAVASMATRGAQATPSQVNDTNVADMRQPSDQPAKNVSADTVPAPSAQAGEASQLAPAIDTGYREVIPVNQPQTEVSNEPVTPVPAISSEGQGDQPGAGEPAAAGAGPAIAGLADRAGSGNPADNTPAPPVPDGQQQNDSTLTDPAPDAGAAVSEVAQPDPVVPAPVAAPTPWAEAIDNPDGTITLKGDVPLIKQWAKDSGVKAMPGKGGLLVAKSSAVKVREFAAPAANEPVQQIEAARAEVAPEPTDAQKEAGNYKKGHLKLQGLDIALENPKGSTRSGTDKDGKAWQSTMAHDYGYIKRTLGADGDHVDVFIGERPDSETVYVVDQVDPKTGKFDEHKVMMGFADEQAAQAGYLANYEKGWKGLGSIKAMPVEEFKRWVKAGDTTKPANDWSGAKSAADYHAAKRRLFSGEMEFSEFQAMSRSALDNAPSLRAELEKKTKQDLLDQMSRFNAARYKNDKKAVVVEAAYNQLIGDLRWAANGDGNTISETYAIGGARQSIEERVAKALDGLTQERYQLFRDKQLSDVAEMQRRREELKQSLTDPQTLDDFKAFIERRGIDKLTQEQRARYEDMVAARNLDRREQERSAKGNETAPSATSSDIIKTKHTKTGDDLFVVQMGERVERDAYDRINAHAKTLGGWYSSFRGKGAVPGFQFKSEEKATEFRAWLGGEVGGASPEVAPDQSTDSEAQPAGKSKQVEALRNRAASARAKAEAVFNADRKENTARRSSMAANARANAEQGLRFAGLLEAIATGIESGEITYLRNLANGAQLEELQSALNRGLWSLPATKIDALVSDGVINRDDSSRYSWSDKATPEQMVEGVSMPGMDYHTDRLREVAIKMQGASGFKQAGAKVMSLVKAAANRDNKTTTLSDPELIAKLKAYVTGSDDYSTSTIKDQIAGYGRLERMGITNHTELRAALRELVRLQRGLNEAAPQRDPVTEKTNALKRRLLNNRNAFIDFFPTPEEYAADLVDRLGIEPGMVVLEPSAGHGMLAEAARDAGATVEAVELAGDLRDILQEKGFSLVGHDFMETTPSQRYDAVIMNPPFSNDMDIDHVRHAFGHLKPGGRLAAIVSSMAGQRSNKKNKAFREWLDDLGASEEMMPEGAFKDSLNPTSVRTKIITIEKPVDAVNGPELKAGASGVTDSRVELGGVSIRIPTIDEEQQRLYNQATHRGHGVNFASGISAGVGRILNDLKDSSLLDTAEQRAAAEDEVQAWANNEAVNARNMMQYGIKNPNWVITGRSGRKAQSSSTTERENNRQTQHHKDQDARIKELRDELKKLRPKEVIGRESFNYAWGKAKGMIAEYASALSGGQPNLLASLRKSMNSELARYLQAMGKIDAQGFIKTLSEQDNRLKAAGYDGLVAIVGARSNPGKIISDAINGRIRFSKQAMAQGEKPAKHLTRKEAELVTKEWFKQYRGASGIDVQIHTTQAELEQALGLAAKDGLIRRAAFDDDNGTLHVAADTIAHPKRMREILRHEVLAHYGLANVLGDGEYTKLISRIIKSKSAPSMKAVWDWVDTHYAGEDVGVQAEEVIAHLAELEQSAWRRGWDQVVAWVTKALRTVGFVPGGITAAETRVLIEGLGKKMKRGGPDNGGPDGGHKFSQESEQPAKKGGLKMSQANTAADKAMEKLNLGPKPDIIDKTKANLDKLRKVDRGVVESWVDRFIKKANTEVLDALAPIKYAEDAAGITDAADSGYVAARMATGAASTMQATMLYGLPEWKDGVIQRKAGTGEKDALLGIFSDLGADLHNWLGWMAGHRAELLMAQGRENLLDANDIAALKGQGKGKEAKFLDAKARWNRLNAATLDLAQEAGLFTKEARAEFESEWYIPFFRESEDGDVIAPFKPKGIANQNAGIKKLKGGEANTNDLLENIFTSTSKLIDASMKNMAAQKTVWNLADTGIIEIIPKPNMMDWRALKNGKNMIAVKMEGEDYMIKVEDPDLYRAMTFFDRQPFGALVNVASKAKRILTIGITSSPEFMLRNFLRDSLSSWTISKDGFKPMIDSIKGVRKTWRMEGSTIDVMFSGASFLGGYVNGNDPGAMADAVRKSLRRKGMTPEQIAKHEKSIVRNAEHAKEILASVWDKYSQIGEAIENGNREAVYDAAIKAGKSHAQAAFESKDLMDFSMLGSSRVLQTMTQVLPFFNARIQGLGKLTRELRDNPREIAKRAGMITAASLALLAYNWDDERYEALQDWEKDSYWHVWLDGQHWRIPKPFEIGTLFGTIPERIVRAMGDKDTGAKFGKAMVRAFGDTFAFNPIPQIIKPAVEASVNYDFFKGAPIDSPQDLAVQAEARYSEQTSLLMRELGELSGFSPKQLEHLVIGYTGTIGGYVMATADGLIRASRPGESASWRADEIPLLKAVYRGSDPAKSTQHMEDFYQMLSEVNQLKRTVDQYRSEGLTDKANELLDEQGGILKSRRSLSRTQQQIRVLRNKIDLIQRDRTMSADEKRKRIDELLARRNDLVYQAVNKNRENWE